jgi:dTDP-4-dehydrorhamnose 3,5-epimerase
MRFVETPLAGAFVIEIDAHADARGFFARTWCAEEFAAHGLQNVCVQTSLSYNEKRGTVRGMHLQLPPSQEAKLVRAIRGALYDVIIDMRPESPTYLRHFGVELDARKHNALYIPPTFAHGFQTLADDTEVHYQMSDTYAPDLAYGLRWTDPAFGIAWPLAAASAIHPRDAEYPDFDRPTFETTLRQTRTAAPGRRA